MFRRSKWEAALLSHPAVHETAVIGKEDEAGLTKPLAFEFLPELPKTAAGKIQRFRLREMIQRPSESNDRKRERS